MDEAKLNPKINPKRKLSSDEVIVMAKKIREIIDESKIKIEYALELSIDASNKASNQVLRRRMATYTRDLINFKKVYDNINLHIF